MVRSDLIDPCPASSGQPCETEYAWFHPLEHGLRSVPESARPPRVVASAGSSRLTLPPTHAIWPAPEAAEKRKGSTLPRPRGGVGIEEATSLADIAFGPFE